MPRLTMMLGKVFEVDKWGIAFNAPDGSCCSFFCEPCEETKPYYGKVFDEDEIEEVINFLQKTLEENKKDVESNLE